LALALALPLALIACNRTAPANNGAAAANSAKADDSAATAEATTSSNNAAAAAAEGEIQGVFRSFDRGDHLWAIMDLPPGREAEETILIEDVELAAFLRSHVGQPLQLIIETRNEFLDPPGEKVDATYIVSASVKGQTWQQWWAALSTQQQATARAEIDKIEPSGPD
jgi:hypothetical protein